jgi:Glycosyl hydrolase family 26
MRGHAIRATFALGAVAGTLWFAPGAGGVELPHLFGTPGQVLAPPSGHHIYRAAFPDFGGREDNVSARRIRRFERLSRSPLAWAYFSNNWFGGRIHFPTKDVREVTHAGAVPFVRLMARSGYGHGPDPNFSMRSIAQGRWDTDLRRWCDGAREAGVSLLAEFGTEVNGDWFPWNGRWNGGGRTDGYGDPNAPDGPESFRDAYRHIVDMCRSRGADDITWFFHVDVGGWPHRQWNRIAAYWPGARYVDWIGVSDYGPLKPGQPWLSFRRRLDRAYGAVAALDAHKPLAVLEYGAAEDPKHPRAKPRWIRRAIRSVASGRWPRIRALSYWHESWQNGNGSISDLHIDSSHRSLRAYRRGIGRSVFTSRARFVPR